MSSTRSAMSLLPSALALALAPACVILGDDGSDASSDDASAMEDESAPFDEGECFEAPHCDPLAPDCGAEQLCAANVGTFDCTTIPEGTELAGEGEVCGATSCDAGLVCVALPLAGCAGSCCQPLCDVEQPQCPSGRVCSPLFSEGGSQCYANLGVCEPQ